MAEIFLRKRSMAQRILENIIFIEEVFADRAEGEIPDFPVLELAKSFELRGDRRSGRGPGFLSAAGASVPIFKGRNPPV